MKKIRKKRMGIAMILLVMIWTVNAFVCIPIQAKSMPKMSESEPGITTEEGLSVLCAENAAKDDLPKLNKKSVTLQPGSRIKLYLKNTDRDAKWSSSKSEIAKVDAQGLVTAKRPGNAIITAKTGKKKATCIVNVKKLTLNTYKLTLKEGSSYSLKCSAKNVKWSSSNKKIASVSNGIVKAKKAGTTIIKAKTTFTSISCKVTVKEKQKAAPVLSRVIGNKNSKKYHTHDCGSLPFEHNRVYFSSAQEAEAQGYSICHNCLRLSRVTANEVSVNNN